jgi:hypothetical protein
MGSKEYYKEIIREHLSQHYPRFLTQFTESNDLDWILDYRAENFLEKMRASSNPQDEKEIYYQEMLTF